MISRYNKTPFFPKELFREKGLSVWRKTPSAQINKSNWDTPRINHGSAGDQPWITPLRSKPEVNQK